MDALKKQAQEAKRFANLVRQLRTLGLDEFGIQQILGMGAEQGTAAAKELIAGGQDAISQANTYYQQVTRAGNQLGQTLATDFYQAGVDSAKAMIEGIARQIFLLQPEIDRITAAMVEQFRTKIEVTIDAILNPINNPTPPSPTRSSASSVGGARLGGMSYASSQPAGTNVNITIKAGVGDPVEIGKQVVQALQAYQRRTGAIKIKVAD